MARSFIVMTMLSIKLNDYNNNNNCCLKSNIQCIEIRVQWTVHLRISYLYKASNLSDEVKLERLQQQTDHLAKVFLILL